LGRGLDALIPSQGPEAAAPDSGQPAEARLIDIDLVAPNPDQPRTRFDPAELQSLAASITEHGIIQPLVVSRMAEGGYRLIAGERRLQAARQAGLTSVPVVIREVASGQLLELALVENIQRADLNPVEEALAYRRLVDEHGHTQEEVARRVGKSRTAVANAIRLLGLEPEIRRSLAGGEISEGHGRALLGLPAGAARLDAWRAAVAQHLSVREVEALARKPAAKLSSGASTDTKGKRPDAATMDIERRLRQALGTRVNVKRQRGGKATITIECFGDEEFGAVVEQIAGGWE
jgi:ParB family chromosome partitioning protein